MPNNNSSNPWISYVLDDEDYVPVSVLEALNTQFGSIGMGLHFVETAGRTELYEEFDGESKSTGMASTLRRLKRNKVYNRGPFMEGETVTMVPTYKSIGKTPMGNTIFAAMFATEIEGREVFALPVPWKYPTGRNRSAHGSAEANRCAMLESIEIGTPVQVTMAKSSGKLLHVSMGRRQETSLITFTPSDIVGGPKEYHLHLYPEVLDDRSKGLPERGTGIQVVRDGRAIWQRMSAEQLAAFQGNETQEHAPAVASLIDEVIG